MTSAASTLDWKDRAITHVVMFAAFALSFAALTDLAIQANIPYWLAWLFPVAVDGQIIAAARVHARRRGTSAGRYARMMIAAGVIVSAAANATHALLPPGPMAPWIVALVAIVPPAALLATHLLLQPGPPVHDTTNEKEATLPVKTAPPTAVRQERRRYVEPVAPPQYQEPEVHRRAQEKPEAHPAPAPYVPGPTVEPEAQAPAPQETPEPIAEPEPAPTPNVDRRHPTTHAETPFNANEAAQPVSNRYVWPTWWDSALAQLREDHNLTGTANNIGVSVNTLRKWRDRWIEETGEFTREGSSAGVPANTSHTSTQTRWVSSTPATSGGAEYREPADKEAVA